MIEPETPLLALVKAMARRQARLDAMPPPAANDAVKNDDGARKQ